MNRAQACAAGATLGALLSGAAARHPAACGQGAHWTGRYVGLPYIPDVHDCSHFVERVQREVFGRTIELPKERPAESRSAELSAAIASAVPDFARPLEPGEAVVDGDGVLMSGAGRRNHIGVAVWIAGERWVLHNSIRARGVVLHRERDLGRHGLELEGHYRWT